MSWVDQVVEGLHNYDKQTLAGDESIDVTYNVTFLTTDAARVPTLADAQVGQIKVVVMVGDSGDAVITPANFLDGTSVTLASVGDWVAFRFNGTQWVLLGYSSEFTATLT